MISVAVGSSSWQLEKFEGFEMLEMFEGFEMLEMFEGFEMLESLKGWLGGVLGIR